MLSQVLGIIAVMFATINIVAGFLITDRMLKMFKKKETAVNERMRFWQAAYIIAALCVVLSIKWLSFPRHGAPRRPGRRNRHAASPWSARCCGMKSSAMNGSPIAFVVGAAIGAPLAYLMPMTVGAAVDRALARLRRAGRRAGRHRRILSRRRRRRPHHRIQDGRAGHRKPARLSHLHRQRHGVRKTAGDRSDAAHDLSRARISSTCSCSPSRSASACG